MLKRILSLFILLTVIVSAFYIPNVGAVEWTEVYENNFKILMGLRIINTREEADYSVFRELSKSAFINFICNIYDDYGYTEEYSEEAVSFAEQQRIIHSGQNNLTKPLYYDEAMTMLVRALGYGIHAESAGGFPYGYNAIAQKLGLNDGVIAKSGERLREYDAITLLYNAINCNYVEIISITTDGIVYGNESDKTFLHEMRKIYKIEGIVDGSNGVSIISGLDLADGKVMIDGYIYDTNIECEEYIGMYTEGYVKETSGDDEIIFLLPVNNREMELDSDDIVNVSADCTLIEYIDSNGDIRKTNVSEIATVIYNGQILDDYSKYTLMPEDGSIKLVDNRDGNAFDIVFVTEYKTVIVNAISRINKTVTNLYTYDKDNINISFENNGEDIIKVYDESGVETEFNNLSVGDVLHIAESETPDKRIVKAYISKKKISEVVAGIKTSDATYIRLGNKEYTLSETYNKAIAAKDPMAESIKNGTTYTFYIDSKGKIVYLTEDRGQVKYGLALGKASDGFFNTNCSIKIISSDGQTKILKLAEYIEFNGAGRTLAENIIDDIPTAKNGYVSLVAYSLNRSGEIISLRLPDKYDGNNYNEFNTSGLNNMYFRAENNSFDAEIFMGNNPVIWFADVDSQGNLTSNEEDYLVKNSGIYDDWAYKFYAYNLDEYGYSDMFVVLRTAATVLSEMEFAEMFVLDKVSDVINSDGETIKMLTGAMGKYESYSFYCADNLSVYNAKDEKAMTEISVDDLRQGDVIAIHADGKGDADRIELISSLADGEVYKNPDTIYAKGAILRGKAERIDPVGGRVQIDCGGKIRTVRATSSVPVIIYDRERDRIRVGTLADVEQGDEIMTRLKWLKTSGFIVFQ